MWCRRTLPLRTIEDVDRDGVRVAVAQGSAYDLYLTRALKHAKLVRQPSGPEALDVFVRDRLEAAGGVRQPIVAFAQAHPDMRVIPGRFMAIEQAMGTVKGRAAGVAYLRGFIEEMKASGFVARALRRAGRATHRLRRRHERGGACITAAQIPAIREMIREFTRFRPASRMSAANRRGGSTACSRFPANPNRESVLCQRGKYPSEHGKTGNLADRAAQRSVGTWSGLRRRVILKAASSDEREPPIVRI